MLGRLEAALGWAEGSVDAVLAGGLASAQLPEERAERARLAYRGEH